MKVLVIGLGNQGKKYIEYFIKNNFEVTGVCKTINTKLFIENKYNIEVLIKLENIIENNIIYDIIVFAIDSELQCEIIFQNINYFKDIEKIFLELPISYNQSNIEKLKKYNNIYFFIEEYITDFSLFLSKLDVTLIKNMNIKIYMNREDLNLFKNKIIHLKGNFLGIDFDFSKTPVNMIYSREYNNRALNYIITFVYNRTNIYYNFGDNGITFKIGDKNISSFRSFDKNLEKFILLKNNSYNKKYNIDLILSNYLSNTTYEYYK